MSQPVENKKKAFLNRILQRKNPTSNTEEGHREALLKTSTSVPEEWTSFDSLPQYKNMRMLQQAADQFGIASPFFKCHEGKAGAKTVIQGKEYINYSHYNYLGFAGHEAVNAAAMEAVQKYGTSSGASRLVAGERPVQQALEQALATHYGTQACAVFVSGHATNVSTIRTLFGPKDLVIHDALIHNSIIEGIQLSGATRRSFAHNDLEALDAILAQLRPQFERVLIAVEGVYSMDGDCIDLPALVDLKKRYQAFLMVDEAHSLGILGATGRGIMEHCDVPSTEVDIWMGTLSKTLAACGGYIAGSQVLIDILKYHAPGFVYSVGIAPPLAAAALQALHLLHQEPERVQKLQHNTQLFLRLAQEHNMNTGLAHGYAIVPIVLGSSRKAVSFSNKLFSLGVNVQPIIHPAVEEKSARLRFFLSSDHSSEDIMQTINLLRQL